MQIETRCNGCVFYKGKVCGLGRHEKFEKNGATVVEEWGFHKISGRFCSARRPEEWAKKHNTANLELIVRAEIMARTEVYIYLQELNEAALQNTINSLKDQVLQPSLVVVVCNNPEIKINRIFKILDESELIYRVDVPAEKDWTRNYAVDITAAKCEAQIYMVLDQGQTISPNFLALLDKSLNLNLKRWLYVPATKARGEVVYFLAHKQFQGNSPCSAKSMFPDADEKLNFWSLQEKLEYAGKYQNADYYIAHGWL